MHLLPAIDLMHGRVVRLRHGDYAQSTTYEITPNELAKQYRLEGAVWIHVVDLIAARAGAASSEHATIANLIELGFSVQLGGGVRDAQTVQRWLGMGVARVILGTAALASEDFAQSCCAKHPGKIVIGVDSKDGFVRIQGWQQGSDVATLTLAQKAERWGAAALLYTEISRDGALQGPAIAATAALQAAVTIPVIASGGVSSLEDIRALSQANIQAAVCGRALIESRIRYADALQIQGVRATVKPGAKQV